jgi:hypothetical protein
MIRLTKSDLARLGAVPRQKRARARFGPKVTVFSEACIEHGLREPVAELRFAPPRKWAFDWAWPEANGGKGVALEVEGGVWTGGRHTRGAGFLKDVEKYNRAALMGWKVLRCTPKDISTGKVFELLREAMP